MKLEGLPKQVNPANTAELRLAIQQILQALRALEAAVTRLEQSNGN